MGKKRKIPTQLKDGFVYRKKFCLFNQARYGTLPLNNFHNKVGATKTPMCKNNQCKAIETRIHFLFYCKTYYDTRKICFSSRKVKNKVKQIDIMTNEKWKTKLNKFIEEAIEIRSKL